MWSLVRNNSDVLFTSDSYFLCEKEFELEEYYYDYENDYEIVFNY